MVKYVPYDGGRVSMRWRRVLRRARQQGVDFHVNSGHRTLREQTALFRRNMVLSGGRWRPRAGRPLTAWPLPTAPHILTGRHAHALDLNGAKALAKWLNRNGVRAGFPVPGEPWHLVVSGRDLSRLSRKLK
jgi:hypothetical protein